MPVDTGCPMDVDYADGMPGAQGRRAPRAAARFPPTPGTVCLCSTTASRAISPERPDSGLERRNYVPVEGSGLAAIVLDLFNREA